MCFFIYFFVICNFTIMEADVFALPIWCDECLYNLALDHFPLPEVLQDELVAWIHDYGKWIDWSTDEIIPGGVQLEQQHNERGEMLAEQMKAVLEGKYMVRFVPSTFARRHCKEESVQLER